MDNGAPLTFNAPSFSIIRQCGATLAEGSGVVRDGIGVVRDGWDSCSVALSGKKKFHAVDSSSWPLNSNNKTSKNK